MSKSRLESVFKLFDQVSYISFSTLIFQDGDGFLIAEELKEFLNPEQFKFKKYVNEKGEVVKHDEDAVWAEIMSQVDSNKDGKVIFF